MKRALSQSQAAEVLRAAGTLPPLARDQFLAEVGDRLRCICRSQLRDDDVHQAIISTLSGINITTSHFMCDAQQEADNAQQSLPTRPME